MTCSNTYISQHQNRCATRPSLTQSGCVVHTAQYSSTHLKHNVGFFYLLGWWSGKGAKNAHYFCNIARCAILRNNAHSLQILCDFCTSFLRKLNIQERKRENYLYFVWKICQLKLRREKQINVNKVFFFSLFKSCQNRLVVLFMLLQNPHPAPSLPSAMIKIPLAAPKSWGSSHLVEGCKHWQPPKCFALKHTMWQIPTGNLWKAVQ